MNEQELHRQAKHRLAILRQTYHNRLAEWEDYYNFDRPHGGLGGQTPYERLKQKTTTNSHAVTHDRQLHISTPHERLFEPSRSRRVRSPRFRWVR